MNFRARVWTRTGPAMDAAAPTLAHSVRAWLRWRRRPLRRQPVPAANKPTSGPLTPDPCTCGCLPRGDMFAIGGPMHSMVRYARKYRFVVSGLLLAVSLAAPVHAAGPTVER